MEDQNALRNLYMMLCISIGILAFITWAFIYNLRRQENNIAAIVARTGWKHELVKLGAVDRRLSSTTNGIAWTLEFKVAESQSDSSQRDLPKILEWRTSNVRLPKGMVVIITTPQTDRDSVTITYTSMLSELDVWLSGDLSPYQVGSINFQGRYTIMSDVEETARQLVRAAEGLLLEWPEWEISRLVPVPTPVLIADVNGISLRIALHTLDVPSNVHKMKNPYVERVLALVQLGVKVAAALRDLR
jgi:hypothetical protein